MTLGPRKEHVMKAKPKQQDEPFDAEGFRIELAHKLDRLVSDTIGLWRRCDNVKCRRLKSCASDGFECLARWEKSRPPVSPEESARQASELKQDLDAYRAGLPLPERPAPAKTRRGKKPASTPTTPAEGGDNRPPPPVAEQPKLAPEKQALIDRAWDDDAASLPAEQARERRPRITQL
jgi:hypothetical protein